MAAPISSVVLLRRLYTRHHIFRKLRLNNGVLAIPSRERSALHDVWRQTDGRPPAASQSAPACRVWLRPLTNGSASNSEERQKKARHPWDFALSPLTSQLIVSGSLLSFMLYFFILREESDVDSAIYRPIWERVPGISPEIAERMLETDKAFGIYYGPEWERSLERYKERYYAEHPEELPRQVAPGSRRAS